MLSKISYALRETSAGFKRNVTLTIAAIVTSAVSLLLVGMTFLMQKGFDNLLVQWKGDVQMIVFVKPDAAPEQIAFIQEKLESQPAIVDVKKLRYLDKAQTYSEFEVLYATNPTVKNLLTPETIVSQFKVVPKEVDSAVLEGLGQQFQQYPGVERVAFASEQIAVLNRLSGFVRKVTAIMAVALLVAAVALIWNTIRTAIFARRREIEVMKLVGATNWFIRIPFMLEGLVQGVIGGVLANVALFTVNRLWTSEVASFQKGEFGLGAMVVNGGYRNSIMLVILVIGALAGAIGSGIATSRFLDV